MSVTLERYFAIVHPLKHFTIKKYLLPVTVVFAVLYNVPKVSRQKFFSHVLRLGPMMYHLKKYF
jgi:hypothetical protein